jgi:hypothetical protein
VAAASSVQLGELARAHPAASAVDLADIYAADVDTVRWHEVVHRRAAVFARLFIEGIYSGVSIDAVEQDLAADLELIFPELGPGAKKILLELASADLRTAVVGEVA